jgi:uncharacterized protein (DUF433 family)
LIETVDQPAPAGVVAHDLLPRIAACHHLIDGALRFDPQSPRHAGTSTVGANGCRAEKQKTKSVTAKPPVRHREAPRSAVNETTVGKKRSLIMKWQDRISIKADVCHGKACIKGRRVKVSVILASLGEGASPETIMANFHLAPEDIQAAMLFAADMAEDQFLPLEQEVA